VRCKAAEVVGLERGEQAVARGGVSCVHVLSSGRSCRRFPARAAPM
jgi:hypothetical protein